jgi:hypothetical protein
MDRLLSPNEAKFWLMDWAAPMNTVIVTRTARPIDPDALAAPSAFRLPLITIDKASRPRWTSSADGLAGVVETSRDGWVSVAERLLEHRVGTEGTPPWHAVVIPGEGSATVVLAVNHAVADYRTGQWLADHFLAGTFPGHLAPACEEVLPEKLFGDDDALELAEEWWMARASARWEAIGLDRLASVLPAPSPSHLDVVRLTERETIALNDRCAEEGGSLNGALAVALRDQLGVDRVAHAIDMSRFVRPALPDGPGIAVSHVFAETPVGDFWEAARAVRTGIFERIQAGEAGDALLILPRALLREGAAFTSEPSSVTLSGFPTYRRADDPGDGHPMQIVLSSARGGGDVVMLTNDGPCLQLISCLPDRAEGEPARPRIDLADLADRLRVASGI